MAEPRIERYFHPETLHPAIRAAGRSVQRSARLGFESHQHDCLEICLITGGSITYFTGETVYTLEPGAIQISQPGEVHGAPDGRLHPCTLAWFQYDGTKWNRPGLEDDLARLPSHLTHGGTELTGFFDTILAECRKPRRDSPLIVEGALLSLLGRLVRLAAESAGPGLPTTLRRALALIDAGEVRRVEDLAARLNTHRSHLHKLFSRYLGQSPQAYLRERIMRRAAEALTETDRPVTDIALALDFHSSQHFATAFKARYGSTPRAFRRAALL